MSLNQFETDEQRADALIDWLKENALFIIAVIVVTFGSIIGWDYYKSHKSNRLTTQASHYYQFEQSLDKGTINDAAYNAVMTDDNAEGFRDLATLQKAAFEAQNNDLNATIAELKSHVKHVKNPVMKDLYRYRLGKALYETVAYDEAMSELNQVQTESLKGLVKDLQGDVYVKQNRLDNAKVVYTEAFDLLQSPIIQGKINQLGKDS